MRTCIKGIELDTLSKIIAEYYREQGYDFDEYDTENNLLVVNQSLMDIYEDTNGLDDETTPFFASGYLKIPYTIFSSTKCKSSSSDVSSVNL